jgi:hypothetical protein
VTFGFRGSGTYKLSRNNDLERLEPLGRNLVVIVAVRVHATADGQKMTGIREPATGRRREIGRCSFPGPSADSAAPVDCTLSIVPIAARVDWKDLGPLYCPESNLFDLVMGVAGGIRR